MVSDLQALCHCVTEGESITYSFDDVAPWKIDLRVLSSREYHKHVGVYLVRRRCRICVQVSPGKGGAVVSNEQLY